MCEVTRNNFQSLLPEICSHIDQSSFLAFDCEFTALDPDKTLQASLFDDIKRRYSKLSSPALHSIISQFGLSIFRHDVASNTFIARTYNFYVSPRSLASVDETFACSTSSLEFLMRFNFDFNKFLYDGVPYLNREKEAQLRRDLAGEVMLRSEERNIPREDEDWIRETTGRLSQWINTSKTGDQMELELRKVLPFILHLEIRNKFSDLWTFSQDQKFVVRKVSAEERKKLEAEDSEKVLAEEVVEEMIGLTKVIRHISQSGKPFVGHNCLLDLIKIYHQFIDPLPAKYEEFKTRINQTFPLIFDTKHICFSTKKKLSLSQPHLEGVLASSNLSQLYSVLAARNDRSSLTYVPRIAHAEGSERYSVEAVPHEAGYDAFMAGFCFVRLAHLASSLGYLNTNQARVLRFVELLEVVREHDNCVNISRAASSHVNLGGEEPVSSRPPKLVVYSRDNTPLDCLALADRFSRFACSDIQQVSRHKALVAVSSYNGARDLLARFREDEKVVVETYSILQHSERVRALLWGGALLGGVLALVASRL